MGESLICHLGRLDPADYTPRLALGGMEAHAAPVRRPPPWKLKRKIGSGSFGVVFLEKAQMSGMEAPELIAVKRISRTVPNFPAKKYKSEIKNFKILSNVSFIQAHPLSQQSPVLLSIYERLV